MIESILIATDGSDAAHVAERYGAALAARLRARCYGLTVIEERVTLGLRADTLGIPPGPLDAAENFLKVRADAACRRLADLARGQGVECTPEAVRGAADDRIVERGQGVDLVVLGRDGDHAAGRSVLIGSTVDGVLRKTSKSALVVPAGAEIGGPVVLAFDGSPGSRVAAKLAVELASPGLLVVLGGQDTVADADPSRDREIHDPPRRLVGDDLEMIGLAADHGAQGDVAVIGLADRTMPALVGEGDGGGNFQGAGHGDHVVLRAERAQRLGRTFQQGVGQVVVEAGFHDQDTDRLIGHQGRLGG